MPFTTEVFKKFFDKAIDVGGNIAESMLKKRIENKPAQTGAPPSRPKIYLAVFKGQIEQGRLTLTEQPLLLERSNLDPQDASISHRHAEVLFRDGMYWIADAGSRNGTFVNNARITSPIALKPNDRIAIGQTVLILRVESA